MDNRQRNTPIERRDFDIHVDVEADDSSINKKDGGEEPKSLSNSRSMSPISTFRHFDISTIRSALNYFEKNNFNNDQNTILKCRARAGSVYCQPSSTNAQGHSKRQRPY
jgi:hypothetical protein